MKLEIEEHTDKTNGSLQITSRVIQAEGVRVYDKYYFHLAMATFVGETVEVRYDAKDSSRVEIVLPDCRVIEAETIDAVISDELFVDNAFELMQYKAINRMLIATVYDALQLRGLWTAINDPLGLEMERNEHRAKFKKIELGMRAAIEKAEALDK